MPVQLSEKKQSAADAAAQEALKGEGALPVHIACIMDGNGRWARRRGRTRVMGHREGVESVRDVTEACAQLGVRHLTLYTFSTENWQRPTAEVELSLADAEARGLGNGDLATVRSNGTSVELRARVNRRLRAGVVRVADEHATGLERSVEVTRA